MNTGSPWIMARRMDVTAGLLERCVEAAAGLRSNHYALVPLRLEGQQNPDRWFIPLPEVGDGLSEIRVVDDPVRIRERDPAGIMELVARALSGTLLSDDDQSRAVAALQAIVSSEGIIDALSSVPGSIIRAALPTPWGRAAARRFAPVRPWAPTRPMGHTADLLPVCTLIDFRDEPDHREHIRIEPISVMCAERNRLDPIETIRILADLEADPFR